MTGFSDYFVATVLAAIGYPKSKGVFRRTDYVEIPALDSAIIQLGRIGTTAGVNEPRVAGQLIAEAFARRDWDTMPTRDLFQSLDCTADIAANPSVPPWVTFANTIGLGPNGTSRIDEDMPWELLGSMEMTALYTITLARGCAWGIDHREEASQSLGRDIGLAGITRQYLATYSVDIMPAHSLEDLLNHTLMIIESYTSSVQSLPDIPRPLATYLDEIGSG